MIFFWLAEEVMLGFAKEGQLGLWAIATLRMPLR